MNAQASRPEGTLEEVKVDAVDHRDSAGQQQERRNVQVVHQQHNPSATTNKPTSGGVLTGAAAAVAVTLQSAKEAISKN